METLAALIERQDVCIRQTARPHYNTQKEVKQLTGINKLMSADKR